MSAKRLPPQRANEPATGLVVWTNEDNTKVCIGLKGNLALVSIELDAQQAQEARALLKKAIEQLKR